MILSSLLLTVLASSQSLVEAWELTKFHTPVEQISSPRVSLASNPIGRRFRTHIRRTVANRGVNFAGHHTVVTWGCGTCCTQFAIVDVRNGRIWHNPELVATRGVNFRPHTRLLVFNPSEADETVFPKIPTEYFEWTGSALLKVQPPKTGA